MYDGMIFPEEQPESIFKKIGNKMKSVKDYFMGSSSTEANVKPLPYLLSQEECLHFFLQEKKPLLSQMEYTSVSKLNFEKCVTGIHHIYSQLYSQSTCLDEQEDKEDRIANIAKVGCPI